VCGVSCDLIKTHAFAFVEQKTARRLRANFFILGQFEDECYQFFYINLIRFEIV